MDQAARPELDWQARWHDLFDATPEIHAQRPDVLPPMGEDMRLHHGFWQLPEAARRAAVEILPDGAALADRVAAWPGDFDHDLPQAEAHGLLRVALADLRLYGRDTPEPDAPITVTDGFPSALLACEAVALDLDDALWEMAGAKSAAHVAALGFVSEPFYRAANDYIVAHWLAWPLAAGRDGPDPYAALARMAAGGWACGWHEDGTVRLVSKRPSHG